MKTWNEFFSVLALYCIEYLPYAANVLIQLEATNPKGSLRAGAVSIVETLKEFRSLLLGQRLVVHTDHKNIVYGNLSNDRIMRWRLLLEEFGPEYEHIAGKDNVVADLLSRMQANFPDDSKLDTSTKDPKQICYAMSQMTRDETFELPDASSFALTPDNDGTDTLPMHPKLIAKEQKKDRDIRKTAKGDDYSSRQYRRRWTDYL